jgi:hypothetical protein
VSLTGKDGIDRREIAENTVRREMGNPEKSGMIKQ